MSSAECGSFCSVPNVLRDNFFPVGKSEPEVPEMRRGYSGAKPLDDLPWIWKAFSKAGYATQWGEDGAAYGTFQYRYSYGDVITWKYLSHYWPFVK